MAEENQEKIFEVLERFTMKARLGKGAPKSDHEFMRLLEEGEEEQDFHKIYTFVDGYERGCMGAWNDLLAQAVKKAFSIDPKRVLEILEKKQSFMERYLLIYMSSAEMKDYYAMHEEKDPLILFEALRQLYEHSLGHFLGDKGKISSEYAPVREAVVRAAVRLSAVDESLWRFWLSRVEYEDRWTDCLPGVWCGLDKKGLEIYAKSIRLDMPPDRMKRITEALRAIPDEKTGFFMNAAAGIVYERWKEYLCKKKEKSEAIQGLLMGGYTNLILYAICFLFDGRELWEKEICRALQEFEEDMFRWYQSQTQLSAYYFTGLSEIYLLLFTGINSLKIPTAPEMGKQVFRVRQLVLRYKWLWGGENGPGKELMELLGN